MTPAIERFGGAVRRLREGHGWSQELLAEKADLNRSYLGEVERGCVNALAGNGRKACRSALPSLVRTAGGLRTAGRLS